MDDGSFSGSDFSAAASATASPETSSADTLETATTDPSLTATETSTDPAATVPATATETRPLVSEKKGPIPFTAHEQALANARTKERATATAEFDRDYGWAKQIPRQSVERMSTLAQRMTTDPAGFLEDYYRELDAHPQHSAAVRSWAARTLGSRRADAADTDPDVQIVDESGRVTGTTYSADRVKAIVAQAVQAAIGKEIAPLKQDRETRLANERTAAANDHADKTVTAMLARAQSWTGFADHRIAIAKAYESNPAYTLQDAYLEVLHRDILPGLSKTARAAVLADINQKPGASTVSPSRGTTAVSRPDSEKSFLELLQEQAPAALGR